MAGSESAGRLGKPFGWAGWLTAVPEDWRPLRIQGTHERGVVDLGDATRPRGQLAWSVVTRKRFDALRTLRRTMQRSARGVPIVVVPGADLEPLLLAEDEKTGRIRFAGFASQTRRVVQGFVEGEKGQETVPELRAILTGLSDQAKDKPHKWSFFSIRFTVPPDFRYREAALTLGDMRVSLVTGSEKPAAELHLRHVYPSELALARDDLGAWAAREWLRTSGERRAKTPATTKVKTELGPAAMCCKQRRARPWLPIGHRPLMEQRCLAIHDETHQRLVIVHAVVEESRMSGIIHKVLGGMYWK